MFRFLLCSVVFAISLFAGVAPASATSAGDGYATPSFKDLIQTTAYFGGQNVMEKDAVFDEYARILYCDLYQKLYASDFEWNKIKTKMREEIQEKKGNYRVLYDVVAPVFLDRYNFEEQAFPFLSDGEAGKNSRNVMDNIGVMEIYSGVLYSSACIAQAQDLQFFLPYYQLILDRPLTLKQMKVPADEAQRALESMALESTSGDKKARVAYIRFRVRVLGAMEDPEKKKSFLRGTVEQIDFFADLEATKFITNMPIRKKRL